MFYIDQMGFTKPYFIKGPFINKKQRLKRDNRS